jgi:hypothetical protein
MYSVLAKLIILFMAVEAVGQAAQASVHAVNTNVSA